MSTDPRAGGDPGHLSDGSAAGSLLAPKDPDPVVVLNHASAEPFFLVCDHAGNAVPSALNGLGLDDDTHLGRHIALDIGALDVARKLAVAFRATLVNQQYSRLVIDCNRLPTAADSIPEVSDGVVIPANQGLGVENRRARQEAVLRPYHERIRALIEARLASGTETVLVSVHSFTPQMRGRPRPWEIGVMTGPDTRFSSHVHAVLQERTRWTIGWNEPYEVDMSNDYTVPVHGEGLGIPYVELELRQDLLVDEGTRGRLVDDIAACLRAGLDRLGRVAGAAATRGP